MLTDEDIEALLYAQVYYGKSADDKELGVTVATEETSNDREENMDDERQQDNEDQPANLEAAPDTTQTVDPDVSLNNLQCSEISTSTASTSSLVPIQIPVSPDNQVDDQQHINQNICPEVRFFVRLEEIKSKITWSKKCEQLLQKFQAELINEKLFFKTLRRIVLLENKQQRRKQAQKRHKNTFNDIVYLSDSSSDSDIQIVSVEKKIMEEKRVTEEVTQISDSGDETDDIIYVEPPPVPIISLDDESDEHSNENEEILKEPLVVEELSLHVDEEASNDFLPATTTSADNFNFSLHGSEFQDAEFVRPANPTDHYETESSTSTSDFNRDSSREFSNTVKTIVFNEVDFPKDIFDDSNNLEKFGELITPKRKDKSAQGEDGLEKAGSSGHNKCINPRTSSESSSESDYDASESHQHLPHLSPMVPVGSSPNKKGKNSGHKKDRPLTDNQELISGEEPSAERKSKKRRKKKNAGDKTTEDLEKGLNSDDSDAPTTAHTSTRSVQLKVIAPTIETEEISTNNETPKKNIKKKNKKQKIAGPTYVSIISEVEELKEETKRFIGDLSTRRGRTRSQKNSEESADTAPLRKKKKKKKKRNKNVEGVALEVLNEGVNQVDAELELIISDEEQYDVLKPLENDSNNAPGSSKMAGDQETACTKVTEEKNKKRKSDNIFERNNNEELEKNKKKKRNSSDKRNSVEDKEVDGVDQNKEKVDENLIKVDEEGDILIIEKTIPLHVIESSESEDIISLGDVEALDEFDVAFLKSKMSDDPLKWQINNLDKNKFKSPGRGGRCRRCRQTGHIAIYCRNEPPIPRCTLCGFEGHEEPRCTKKVCFTCGASGNFSTVYCYKCVDQRKVRCTLCSFSGHSKENCPDLWRRYHLTTKPGPLIVPKDKSLKPRKQRWCSGCAENGHFEYQCKSYKWLREYPSASAHIFKYQDVYNDKTDNSVKPAIDLREKLDSNRENTDLREKLNDKKRNSSTKQDNIAPTAQTDADTNGNAQTSTEAPKVSQPMEIPSTESTLPSEVPQSLEVFHPENPIPHVPAERKEPQKSQNFSDIQPVMNKSKPKEKRQRQNRRLNPVSMMNNRYKASSTMNPWLSNRYESVLNPQLAMDRRPYSNQIQPFLNQNEGFAAQIQPFSNQIQPYSNQIQQLNLFNPIPTNLLPYSYYQQPQYYDFSSDNRPWNANSSQMPVNARLNYCEPQPSFLDFSDPIPNDRHLPVNLHLSSGDSSNATFTITREPSPRLSDYYREQQPALAYEPPDNQPVDRFTSRQQDANVSCDNPPIPGLSLERPIKPLNSSKDNEAFKLEEATAEKFSTLPMEELQSFLKFELEKLDNIKNPDPRAYKKKLSVINQLKKVEVKTNSIKKQMYFHYKQINMYLFGVQRLERGDKNLSFLRNFVYQPGKSLIENKRASLLEAFNYIFGGEHLNFNYMKHLNISCMKSISKGQR